jgi:eukaryotic-like serine/threonine-protein kinase
MQKRFVREAKLLAKFQHPNLPYVLTEGVVQAEFGKAPYFVMEYIQGESLQEVLRKEQHLEPHVAVGYAMQVLDALGYAHSNKIVHRDVKPANIMIDGRGRCFLIDFSIGVSFDAKPGLTRATTFGAVLGTTAYMPPEQLEDASKVDGRADLYSMGVVLLEMLSGKSDRGNIARSLAKFPRGLVAAVEKACAANPEDRFKNADEFMRAIGGSRPQQAPLTPSLAICTNLKCSGANWSSRGYYRGPRVVESATDSHCTNCGDHLVYQCKGCGAPITNNAFCGSCGSEILLVPECKLCSSWLTREYMDTMGADGCRKCLPVAKSGNVGLVDENIPF